MIKRQGRRQTPRPESLPSAPGRTSIATAPCGEPVTITGLVVRITLQPAYDDAGTSVVVRATDGSGEAAPSFARADARRVSTGAHVIADGMFDAFDPPRSFDPLLFTIVEG